MQNILQSAVHETLEKFKDKILKPEELAATVIDLRDPNNLKTANFRGYESISREAKI